MQQQHTEESEKENKHTLVGGGEGIWARGLFRGSGDRRGGVWDRRTGLRCRRGGELRRWRTGERGGGDRPRPRVLVLRLSLRDAVGMIQQGDDGHHVVDHMMILFMRMM